MFRPLDKVAKISAQVVWLLVPYFLLGQRTLQAYARSPLPHAALDTLPISAPPISTHSLTEHLLCACQGHSPCLEEPTDRRGRYPSKQLWLLLSERGAHAGP